MTVSAGTGSNAAGNYDSTGNSNADAMDVRARSQNGSEPEDDAGGDGGRGMDDGNARGNVLIPEGVVIPGQLPDKDLLRERLFRVRSMKANVSGMMERLGFLDTGESGSEMILKLRGALTGFDAQEQELMSILERVEGLERLTSDNVIVNTITPPSAISQQRSTSEGPGSLAGSLEIRSQNNSHDARAVSLPLTNGSMKGSGEEPRFDGLKPQDASLLSNAEEQVNNLRLQRDQLKAALDEQQKRKENLDQLPGTGNSDMQLDDLRKQRDILRNLLEQQKQLKSLYSPKHVSSEESSSVAEQNGVSGGSDPEVEAKLQELAGMKAKLQQLKDLRSMAANLPPPADGQSSESALGSCAGIPHAHSSDSAGGVAPSPLPDSRRFPPAGAEDKKAMIASKMEEIKTNQAQMKEIYSQLTSLESQAAEMEQDEAESETTLISPSVDNPESIPLEAEEVENGVVNHGPVPNQRSGEMESAIVQNIYEDKEYQKKLKKLASAREQLNRLQSLMAQVESTSANGGDLAWPDPPSQDAGQMAAGAAARSSLASELARMVDELEQPASPAGGSNYEIPRDRTPQNTAGMGVNLDRQNSSPGSGDGTFLPVELDESTPDAVRHEYDVKLAEQQKVMSELSMERERLESIQAELKRLQVARAKEEQADLEMAVSGNVVVGDVFLDPSEIFDSESNAFTVGSSGGLIREQGNDPAGSRRSVREISQGQDTKKTIARSGNRNTKRDKLSNHQETYDLADTLPPNVRRSVSKEFHPGSRGNRNDSRGSSDASYSGRIPISQPRDQHQGHYSREHVLNNNRVRQEATEPRRYSMVDTEAGMAWGSRSVSEAETDVEEALEEDDASVCSDHPNFQGHVGRHHRRSVTSASENLSRNPQLASFRRNNQISDQRSDGSAQSRTSDFQRHQHGQQPRGSGAGIYGMPPPHPGKNYAQSVGGSQQQHLRHMSERAGRHYSGRYHPQEPVGGMMGGPFYRRSSFSAAMLPTNNSSSPHQSSTSTVHPRDHYHDAHGREALRSGSRSQPSSSAPPMGVPTSLDVQYAQLQQHINSIRDIFAQVMADQQKSSAGGPQYSLPPLQQSSYVPVLNMQGGMYSSSPNLDPMSLSAGGSVQGSGWISQQQPGVPAYQQQQQLVMALMSCQQQLNLQHLEMRQLHALCQELLTNNNQQLLQGQQGFPPPQHRQYDDGSYRRPGGQQMGSLNNVAHAGSNASLLTPILNPEMSPSAGYHHGSQSNNSNYQSGKGRQLPVSTPLGINLDTRPLSSGSLYNLLAPNPYLTSPYYPPPPNMADTNPLQAANVANLLLNSLNYNSSLQQHQPVAAANLFGLDLMDPSAVETSNNAGEALLNSNGANSVFFKCRNNAHVHDQSCLAGLSEIASALDNSTSLNQSEGSLSGRGARSFGHDYSLQRDASLSSVNGLNNRNQEAMRHPGAAISSAHDQYPGREPLDRSPSQADLVNVFYANNTSSLPRRSQQQPQNNHQYAAGVVRGSQPPTVAGGHHFRRPSAGGAESGGMGANSGVGMRRHRSGSGFDEGSATRAKTRLSRFSSSRDGSVDRIVNIGTPRNHPDRAVTGVVDSRGRQGYSNSQMDSSDGRAREHQFVPNNHMSKSDYNDLYKSNVAKKQKNFKQTGASPTGSRGSFSQPASLIGSYSEIGPGGLPLPSVGPVPNNEFRMPANNLVNNASQMMSGHPVLNLNINSDPQFDSVREIIYSEVATLISQNENRPDFLLELVKELQLLSSDYLRSRALQAIRQILNRYLTMDPELDENVSNGMNNLAASRLCQELTQLAASASPRELQQLEAAALAARRTLDLEQDSRQEQLSRNDPASSSSSSTILQTRSRGEESRERVVHQQQYDSRPPQRQRNVSKSKTFDNLEDIPNLKETELNNRTVVANNTGRSPPSSRNRPIERIQNRDFDTRNVLVSNPALPAVSSANSVNRDVVTRISGSTQGAMARAVKPADVSRKRVGVLDLEHVIQAIIKELTQYLAQFDNQAVCAPSWLTQLRQHVIQLASAKYSLSGPAQQSSSVSSDEELMNFFHRQLSSILDDTLAKFAGQTLQGVSDELLADISDVIFNELAFFRVMQNINGGAGRAGKNQVPAPPDSSSSVQHPVEKSNDKISKSRSPSAGRIVLERPVKVEVIAPTDSSGAELSSCSSKSSGTRASHTAVRGDSAASSLSGASRSAGDVSSYTTDQVESTSSLSREHDNLARQRGVGARAGSGSRETTPPDGEDLLQDDPEDDPGASGRATNSENAGLISSDSLVGTSVDLESAVEKYIDETPEDDDIIAVDDAGNVQAEFTLDLDFSHPTTVTLSLSPTTQVPGHVSPASGRRGGGHQLSRVLMLDGDEFEDQASIV